ncbi:MAG: penicillin-binding protein 2 [Eubacterium sp.]|nr:penicillin-binding protein 2 [Eubacterium sp.]
MGKKTVKRIQMKMKRKLSVVFAIITLAFLALIGRITYINAVSGEKYTKIVLSQQSYDSRTIACRRGDITDINGTILATSRKVYGLVIDSKILSADEDMEKATVAAICECFEDLDSAEITEYIDSHTSSSYHVLVDELSYDEISDLVAIDENDEDYPNVGGIWFEESYEREYPYSTLAASLIGFTSSDGSGMLGIESSYDDELTGVNGREYGYLNSDSDVESTVIDAEDGYSVVSTIDVNIQSIVEEKIEAFNKAHAGAYDEDEDGSANTAVIVADPNDGSILAMANYPSFDLSNPRDLSEYYTKKQIAKMDEDEQYEALNEIWQNYCVTETYEPGSTAKVFTVAGGLDSGVLSGNETYVCDGYQNVGGYKIKCSHVYGHGTLTLSGAIEQSCNDALMQIAAQMGVELFCHYQNIFNFGLRTGIDLPGEALTSGLIYNEDNMDSASLATNSFGQNFNCTMIQLEAAFSSVINGGYYYRPHVVDRIVDSEGNTVETIDPVVLKETVSDETCELLREYLYQTVEEGTATDAAVKGYTIGGKTGTAEKLPRGNGKYLVSFIGFAPVDDPQVVVYVVIDEPNDENQAQSSFATELAHDLFKEILPYMNIFKEDSSSGGSSSSGEEGVSEYETDESTLDASGDQ